jgi:hypothetical protein
MLTVQSTPALDEGGIEHINEVCSFRWHILGHVALLSPQSSSASRFTAGCCGFFILKPTGKVFSVIERHCGRTPHCGKPLT